MKKRLLLVMAVFVVVAIGLTMVVPASACCYPQGCTPGYWKQPQHEDSWGPTGYAPDDDFEAIFGVDVPGDWTLLEALSAQNKDVGSGVVAAFMRHAVAALLNTAHGEVCFGWDEDYAKWFIQNTWGEEWAKDFLAGANESGCPLD
jgi:hypothetical protein